MAARSLPTATLLIAIASLTLQGCATFAGAGRDVSSAGKTITKTANDAGRY